ncbi:hypothetical protein G9U51_08410 [Calidifontibacter sp. DB0510]|uniref:Uncharacterized protein n=1 Tax=Metallococcus carri TaxID=1656884 RepID=A0A967B1J6_9MICO|nr:hypothetical protein [Metallococcus carri]NHN55798.1 hypothetical protein [Metallococcus carri]NOP38513.1 hypothetical protein [Calidifontibacter sp. DB2511S]
MRDCGARIPVFLAMCKVHWRALRQADRDEVWASYYANGPGSPAHMAVIVAVARRAYERSHGGEAR